MQVLFTSIDDLDNDYKCKHDDETKLPSTVSCILSQVYAGRTVKFLRLFLYLLLLAILAHVIAYALFFDVATFWKDAAIVKSNSVDAVVTIATGKYSATRLISTLRKAGRFDRPIYVVTDDPDVVESHGAIPLLVHDFEPSFESDEKRANWENSKIAKVKWYKTQIFNMLPEESNTVLFLDADVEIHKSLAPFEIKVASYKETLTSTKCTSYCFKERLDSEDSYNSGTCVYFRDASSELLHEWGREILTGAHIRDQLALDATLKRTGLKMCNLPSKMHYYTAATWWTWFGNVLSGGQMQRHAIFVHATSHKSLRHMASE